VVVNGGGPPPVLCGGLFLKFILTKSPIDQPFGSLYPATPSHQTLSAMLLSLSTTKAPASNIHTATSHLFAPLIHWPLKDASNKRLLRGCSSAGGK
jgi:hypothetical protein